MSGQIWNLSVNRRNISIIDLFIQYYKSLLGNSQLSRIIKDSVTNYSNVHEGFAWHDIFSRYYNQAGVNLFTTKLLNVFEQSFFTSQFFFAYDNVYLYIVL